MTAHADPSNREQLLATATELQAMADLIEKYPAEAQLIMAALEDGLTLGRMYVDDRPSHPHDPSCRCLPTGTQT